MEFRRKSFADNQIVIISETPLEAANFEEKMAQVVPSAETAVHAFETYQDAYDFCSKARTAGLFFLFRTEATGLPGNALDELAAPFEALGSSAGLVVIAKDSNAMAAAYKAFGKSSRLLDIRLSAEISTAAGVKEFVLSALDKYEELQSRTVAPQEELDFLSRTARKFEDIDVINRITHLVTSKLDKTWHDNLIVEAAPIVLSIPESHRWIIQNAKGLSKLSESIELAAKMTTQDLIAAKEPSASIRASVLSFRLYTFAKNGSLDQELESITAKASSFSPALARIIKAEKVTIQSLFAEVYKRKSA